MSRGRRGFTLIELMVVVAILGVLAALAIPAFLIFIRRSKASEAAANLNNLFKSASALYSVDRTGKSIHGTTVTSCIVGPTPMTPSSPNHDKQKFTATGNFRELDFSIADYVYYGYGVSSIGSADGITCLNGAPNTAEIYTLYAHGDLDGDGRRSTFELAVGSDYQDQLYHARGLYIALEHE